MLKYAINKSDKKLSKRILLYLLTDYSLLSSGELLERGEEASGVLRASHVFEEASKLLREGKEHLILVLNLLCISKWNNYSEFCQSFNNRNQKEQREMMKDSRIYSEKM